MAESDTLGYSKLAAGSLRMDIDKYDRKGIIPTSIWEMIKYYGNRVFGRSKRLERA